MQLLRTLLTPMVMLKDAARACAKGDAISQCAALSYYTFFAIAPLFVIVLAVAGLWFGEEAARRELFGQLNQLVGADGGEAIQSLVAAAHRPKTGLAATALAFGTLVFASTTVFLQLQSSLNRIWNVQQRPGHAWRILLRHRLLSFAMILAIGFLLLVSLIVSAGLAALGHFMNNFITTTEVLLRILNFVLSLAIITALFAMIFRWLPDVRIGWRYAWMGGFVTAMLFNLGKLLFGLYIGRTGFGSIYGAVGSIVVVLLWVYYSGQIVLFGAQFIRLYALHDGAKVRPVSGMELIPLQSGKQSPATKQ